MKTIKVPLMTCVVLGTRWTSIQTAKAVFQDSQSKEILGTLFKCPASVSNTPLEGNNISIVNQRFQMMITTFVSTSGSGR